MKTKILSLIYLIAECHETELSEARAAMIESDLRDFSINDINLAWKKYRSFPNNRKMPTAAELINLIPDGHPTAQESWAMIPQDEYKSVVWSNEMREAYSVAAPLINQGNISGAFFAYKEAYEKLITASRAERKKPKWSLSPGYDKNGRDTAIVEAIQKGRMTIETALKYHPELEYNPNYEQLLIEYSGKQTHRLESQQGKDRVKTLIGSISKNIENV